MRTPTSTASSRTGSTESKAAAADCKNLYYKTNGKGQINLLKDFNARGNAWSTLGSMRNVDRESLVEVSRSSRAGEV